MESILQALQQHVAAISMSAATLPSWWRILLLGTSSFVTVLATAVFGYHLHLSLPRSGEAPVLWSWLPLLGCAIELGMEPVKFMQKNAEKYGEIFGFVVAGHRTFIVADPHSHAVILKQSSKSALSFREFHDMLLINFFGSSAATIAQHPYDDDRARKQFSNFLLSDSALHSLTCRMQLYMHRNLKHQQQQQEGVVVDMYDFLGRIIFKASIAALINDAAADQQLLYESFMTFDENMALAAGGLKIDYLAAAKRCRDVMLRACRAHKSDDNCELLQRRWEDFTELQQKKLCSAADAESWQLAIVWASVGNTMPGTFWVLFYLLNHPQFLDRVRSEVIAAMQSNNSNNNSSSSNDPSIAESALLSQQQLDSLTFTDACITEAFRLTTGSLIMRHVRTATALTLASGRTFHFRAGDRVGLCPPIHHHDAEIFPDPEAFNPLRWMLGDSPQQLAMSAQGKLPLRKNGKVIEGNTGYLAFGGGVTYCPGRRFARNEIKTLVAYLITQFRFQFVPPPAASSTGTAATGAIATDKATAATTRITTTTGATTSTATTAAAVDAEVGFVPEYPQQDGARAGIGIFPPKKKVFVRVHSISC